MQPKRCHSNPQDSHSWNIYGSSHWDSSLTLWLLGDLNKKKKSYTLLPNSLRSLMLSPLLFPHLNRSTSFLYWLAIASVGFHEASLLPSHPALTVIIFANNFIFYIFPCVMSQQLHVVCCSVQMAFKLNMCLKFT